MPGGAVEAEESPQLACRREVAEELGLDRPTGRILAVDWVPSRPELPEGLIIISGSAPGRNWRRPVRILDVVRAAVGEVEDYARVLVHRMPPVAVVGGAVSDVVHLVAELVENAAVFSPPHTQVRIQGEEVANGFVLEIDDRGLGMGEEAMAAANTRLATGGDFDLADTDRLGLFVISRLSARHGVRVLCNDR